jgi:OOP family OmpA-OmpF porin
MKKGTFMKKASIAILGLTAAAFSLPAAAQFYAGGGLGQSKFKDELSCEGVGSPFSCDDKDTSFKLFGGYQVNRNFAAEATYQDFGKAKISGLGANAELKSYALDVSALGMLPFANQFAAYGRLGLYYASTDGSSNVGVNASESNTGLTYGIGLQWDPMPKLGVRLEYQIYNDVGGGDVGKGDVNVLGLSALWRF